MNNLHIGDLTDKITIELAKPMLIKLAKDRVERTDITGAKETALKLIVNLKKPTSSQIAKAREKTPQYVGRLIENLRQK